MRLFSCLILFVLGSLAYSTQAQECTLPPPSNISYNFPTPGNVIFTWNAVPGAVGYNITLTNLNTGTSQTIFTPHTNKGFVVNPNTSYHFTIRSACSETLFGVKEEEVYFITAPYLIVNEIFPEMQDACPASSIWSQKRIDKSVDYYTPITLDPGTVYNFEFYHSPSSGVSIGSGKVSAKLIRTSAEGVKIWRTIPDESNQTSLWVLLGEQQWPCPPGLNTCHVFGVLKPTLSSETYFKVTLNPDGRLNFRAGGSGTFSHFSLRQCSNESGKGAFDQVDESYADTEARSDKSNVSISTTVSPNPFSDQIRIQVEEPISADAQIQVLDASGYLKADIVIGSNITKGAIYTIPTADFAAGLYLLRIHTPQGTSKVVKMIKL
jgi:hypothetical protein